MTGRRSRVVYWLKQPTPYFVERLNAIADRDNLDIEAWFDTEREPDRSWAVNSAEWRFPARYIPTRSLLGYSHHLPLAELWATRPDVFVHECDRLYLTIGFLVARVLATRTAFRALPNFDSWSQRTWWREMSKHYLFRAVDAIKVPGPDGIAQARAYGAPRERIFTATQGVNVAHYAHARQLDQAQRVQMRARLGLTGCTFIYVGRLWAGKGVDYLFEAYRAVRATDPDVSLLVLGDGVDEQRYRDMAQHTPGVVYGGFVQAPELPTYYGISDVMVFPTLGDPNGLVVEEAMAAGLPVISTEAAGDIRRRVPEGEAGYVVPAADAAALADRMLRLARDATARRRMGATAAQFVQDHTPDHYARDFEIFVGRLLSLPRRRTPAALFAWAAGCGLLAAGVRQRQTAPRYRAIGQE